MRAIHVFSILLIVLTTAVCVYVINTTADFSPFSGSFGVTEATAIEWGGEGMGAGLAPVGDSADHEAEAGDETGAEVEATAEATESATEEAEATAEATEEA